MKVTILDQNQDQRCAICQCSTGVRCTTFGIGSTSMLGFNCQACGTYLAGVRARARFLDTDGGLTAVERSALSYQVRTGNRGSRGDKPPEVTEEWLCHFLTDARLPTASVQVANLLRLIGDHQSKTGDGYLVDGALDAPAVGALNPEIFIHLLREVHNKNLIMNMGKGHKASERGGGTFVGDKFGLTLDGWDRYEGERRGKFSGRYGFIALKFNDLVLDDLVNSWIRPQVKEQIGHDVVHLQNVARAGIIDNIMREQIRDSAFVLSDLTHDNAGAYWEAGYAEGLGKPVIYICERAKFDGLKTHFDTNHCTTVMWETGDEQNFINDLVATIRRSLNLF